MAAVSWRYPQDEFTALQRQNAEAEARANVTAAGGIDVSSLRFRYPINGDFPPWRPAQAFDDRRKVYIQFLPDIARARPTTLYHRADGRGRARHLPRQRLDLYCRRPIRRRGIALGSSPQQTVRISRTDGR